ncbi:unnamed protein product [Leptosia nina]|uniref:FP protein C-terminal domain-containing protein n=1 Tax=Leptosia nina TaxID=320188 RepID=A0AAV1JUR3_9NEOP
MAPSTTCAKCFKDLHNKDFLCCQTCKLKYDLDCAEVSPGRFADMYARQKVAFKCPACTRKLLKSTGSLQTSNSEDSAHDPSSEDSSPKTFVDNITLRPKAAGKPYSKAPSQTVVTEDKLRDILQHELSSILTATIKQLVTTELSNLSEQFSGFQESISLLNLQLNELKASNDEKNIIIANLTADNENLKSSHADLQKKLSSVEQHMRANNIIINGIPETKSENLFDTVCKIANSVDCPLLPNDLHHVTRISKNKESSSRPRSVVVKLQSPLLRDTFIAAVSKFNKNNPRDKLNSRHLGISGMINPIFVSEHLTPENSSLYSATRIKAKECQYKFVWIRNGRVFARKNENSRALLIGDRESLDKIV